MNSEEYIKQAIREELDGDNIYVAPEIGEKRLVNAATKIANSIETGKVIGIWDTTFLGNGKEGIVFTGEVFYFKDNNLNPEAMEISLKNISDVKFNQDKYTDDKDKIHTTSTLTVNYEDETVIQVETESASIPLKGIYRMIRYFNTEVDVVEATSTDVTLQELGGKAIELYFKLIINYFNADNQIDTHEYRELCGIMANVGMSEDSEKNLREYRLSENDNTESNESLIIKLKETIPYSSQSKIFDSLIKDILFSKTTEELNEWESDIQFKNLAKRLGVKEERIKIFKNIAENERKKITDRLNNSEIEEMTKEGLSMMASAGIAAGTLMVSASPLFLFVFSTGGLALLGFGAGAAGVAAYKTLSGGKNEKYALRNEALQNRIKTLTKAQACMLGDINYLTTKIVSVMDNLDQLEDKFGQVRKWAAKLAHVEKSSSLALEEQDTAERETILSELPDSLEEDKFKELVSKKAGQERLVQGIHMVYDENFQLMDKIELEKLEMVQKILESIEYNKVATAANAKSLATKVTSEEFKVGTKKAATEMFGKFSKLLK